VLIFFFGQRPDPEGARTVEAYEGPEEVRIDGLEMFVHFVDGIAVSKFNKVPADRLLKTRGTARNLNTVRKLAELLEAP
jgi:uncharacterized protein (DUF1697 family)